MGSLIKEQVLFRAWDILVLCVIVGIVSSSWISAMVVMAFLAAILLNRVIRKRDPFYVRIYVFCNGRWKARKETA